MGLTVRDVMQLDPFRQVKLLAGLGGLDHEIASVNIIEVPDAARWMKGGELLFSSGFSFHGSAEQGCALLNTLCKNGITALALKPGKYMQRIPKAMIDLADELKFPLLELPEDMPYSTCMEAVYRQLLSHHLITLEHVATLHSELLKAVVDHGMAGLLSLLSHRFGTVVYYVSAEDSVREDPLPFSGGIPEEILSYAEQLYRSGACEAARCGNDRYLAVPVVVQGSIQGFLIAGQGGGADEHAYQSAGLQYAANLVAMENLKSRELMLHEQRLQGELLASLMESRCTDSEIAYRRGLLLGFDLQLPFVVFALQSVPAKGPEDAPDRQESLWKEFQHSVKQYAAGLKTGVMFTRSSSCCFGILSLPGTDSPETLREFFLSLLERLLGSYPSVTAVIGLSRRASGLEKIPAACEEAREAAKVLRCVEGLPPVSCIDGLGIYRVLIELEQSSVMRDFYERSVRSIEEYDQKNGMLLLDTLACYFDHGCNLRVTSETMFLHKNSVSYRLRKIEELLGCSLSDPSVSLSLQLCMKYRKIL